MDSAIEEGPFFESNREEVKDRAVQTGDIGNMIMRA
jgi:hypothetical protein